MKTKVYETKKMGNNKRMVTSMTVGESLFFDVLKLVGIGFLYLAFFWIIIPVKLLSRKK